MLTAGRKVAKYLSSTNKRFQFVDMAEEKDLGLKITRLYHKDSGAIIYNIRNEDEDNTFAPIVKTLPEDDTGCPHILEHLACCGSQKYPIRDPFFNMLKRSVNTYMNAWTGDDFTAYPFSSANPKDHQNLYSVYLDMSLRPLLNQLDFRQEGWRWECPQNSEQKQLKGIVLNEMKGAYQNPQRQLFTQLSKHLCSGTPYGFDSGGKPESIVKLSYDQVRKMHAYYYHPSNMSFYYYGNQDITEKLQFLHQNYLVNYLNQQTQYIYKSLSVNKNMKPPKERYHEIWTENLENPNVAVSYNLGFLKNITPVQNICLNILSYLLLQTNQAILYQDFIQSGLADSFGYSGFFNYSIPVFGVSLQNSNLTQQEALKKIEDSLRNLIVAGADSKRVDEYVHQSEIEMLSPKQTQGIYYLQICLPYMNNRLPLTNLMEVKKNLREAVEVMKNRDKLGQFINKFFIKNESKVSIKQHPAKQKSNQKLIGLDMDINMIRKQQEQLKKRQQSKDQNSAQCLPFMKLNDLIQPNKKQYQTLFHGKTSNGLSVTNQYVKIDNPGIHFLKVGYKLNINEQRQHLLKFLHLWTYVLNKGIAIHGLSNKQLSSKLNNCSRNFRVTLKKTSSSLDADSIHIVFEAECLSAKVQEYLGILNKIIHQPIFEKQNISNIFRNYKSEMIEQLMGTPIKECVDYCSSFVTRQGRNFNTYAWKTQGIKVSESQQVPKQFSQIHQILLNQCEVSIIEHSHQNTASILDKFGLKNTRQAKLQSQQKRIQNNVEQKKNHSIAVTHTFDVNFCCQQYPGPSYLSEDHAKVLLLLAVLEQDYLHPKIREKGGAYGARAQVRQTGAISFYSYMDPYSKQTFQAFDQSVNELISDKITNEQLQQTKVKILGIIDRPITPQEQCLTNILKKVTNKERDNFRHAIINADAQSVISMGSKYLRSELKQRVIFGKDVPEGFKHEHLDIPKNEEEQKAVQL